jgi:2-polyprenyl-3-methyl-5-hydroxy-6-metoxy-1,4-benzoquinol methylase
MIGTLLKDLMRALRQYMGFHVRRVFGRGPRQGGIGGAAPVFGPKHPFDWLILSQENGQICTGGPSPTILNLLVREPKFILDVGCSSGDFAAGVKQRFPHAQVWGVEPNKGGAAIAASRIDRVLCSTIETIDWEKEGVRRGDIDTVLLFDVLEHIYDPWQTLLTLRNLVSDKAQLLISIPNVRNVFLIQDLISGYWRYRLSGLLDITHIRFFTKNDMYRMFYQTGFRVVGTGSTRCPASAEVFERHRGGEFPQTVELQSASVKVHSLEDLASLCTLQHTFALQPADYDQLSLAEREWIDAPHPATTAFPAD